MYDWANSAYQTTIVAAVFPIYFANVASAGIDANITSSRFASSKTIAILLTAIIAPILGALADARPLKKPLLAWFLGVGVAATAAMFWIQQGDWKLALSLSTTLAAGPTQTGAITMTVGAPTVFAQVLAQSDAVDRPLTSEQVEGIITGVWGVVGGQADAALAKLPMPAVAGITLGAPAVEGRDGFVVADLSVQ